MTDQTPSTGHNSGDETYRIAADEFRQFIERLERLEAEKRDVLEQIKEVKSEAKSRGYMVQAINKLLAIRKRDKDKVDEEDAVLDMYKKALGM